VNITDVRLRRIETEGKLRAYVSITFDDSFVVHDLRVIDGNKGMFVAMPSKRLPNGDHKDIAHPINTEVRDMIQKAVLEVSRKNRRSISWKSGNINRRSGNINRRSGNINRRNWLENNSLFYFIE